MPTPTDIIYAEADLKIARNPTKIDWAEFLRNKDSLRFCAPCGAWGPDSHTHQA